ncbi:MULTISPECIES: polysaccharide deacetylase family protein [unclassified Nostoc]|uniref:polysaccharide deacetylase family protein n=1 Tax=unclassified Nostoc TaxID=2593658 RepID=UPI002AD30F80|nr:MULTISPECIES: polysaccharide deacetylase family protein [unclassified Nostoc]MDZ8031929.1 polysaccharide deacetylase family protein [Nostoc sp. DedSLP04]MDZ8127569.1 polysaccharide deacetylase family protein [Nostoc sp. DedQUE07]
MKIKQKRNKPIASLSLDLDNIWSYLKNQGAPGWQTYPSYLDIAVPRFLDILKQWDLTITVFIVGQDAALEKNTKAIQAIASAGHEVGNHSFYHDPWLHLYSENEIEEEVALAEEHIKRVTHQHPIGFRGPGYSFSPAVLKVLARRGYEYDASTFPTFLGPIARAYYLITCKLSKEERKKREALFGGFKEGLQPLKPYQWKLDKDKLTEIPVTTMPIFKVPIHFSYIMFLSTFSSEVALLYLRIALWLCKVTRVQPSLLLHPTDFVSQEDVPELSFFPGMSVPTYKKLAIVNKSLEMISSQFNVLTVGQHAKFAANAPKLTILVPQKR